MSQEHFQGLVLILKEKDECQKKNFDEVIDRFSQLKPRKKLQYLFQIYYFCIVD